MKRNYLLLSLLCFSLLVGCAAPTKTTTTTSTDPATLAKTVTVTEEPEKETGLWESENLNNYYDMVKFTAKECRGMISTQANAILKTSNNVEYTKTEAVMMSVIQSQQIANLKCDPLNIKPPTVLADWANQNLLGILNFSLLAYKTFGSDPTENNDSPSLTNNGSGNIFFNSDGNMNPSYNLEAGETVNGINFYGNGYSPVLNDASTKQDSRSYGLF